jgi:ATP-dependent Zn protease
MEYEYSIPYIGDGKIVNSSYLTYKNDNMYIIGTTMDKNSNDKIKKDIMYSINSFSFGENKNINAKLNSNNISQDNGRTRFDFNDENLNNCFFLITIFGFLLITSAVAYLIFKSKKQNKDSTNKEKDDGVMALITCKECGKVYSGKENACTNCACPTRYNIN